MKTIQMIDDIVLKGRDCAGIEWIDGVVTALHIIRMPGVSDKGFYRSAVSLTYFIERETKNFYQNYYLKRKTCPKRVSVSYSHDSINLINSYRFENIPAYAHDSIWDFYDHIKYDRRKKRYI